MKFFVSTKGAELGDGKKSVFSPSRFLPVTVSFKLTALPYIRDYFENRHMAIPAEDALANLPAQTKNELLDLAVKNNDGQVAEELFKIGAQPNAEMAQFCAEYGHNNALKAIFSRTPELARDCKGNGEGVFTRRLINQANSRANRRLEEKLSRPDKPTPWISH